jgi:flavodoxin I
MAMRTKAVPLLLAAAVCYLLASWTVTSYTAPRAFSASSVALSKKTALRTAATQGARRGCKGNRVCMNAVGLFYSTQTGNTEAVAGLITEATGVDAQLIDDIETEDLAGYDGLIVGAPTWNTDADELRSGTAWDDVLDTIRGLDLKGKPVAVFGCGDSGSYGDNFCDAIEEVHSTFSAAGAKMLGQVDASGYSHSASKSDAGGKFLGLPCDQDNEADMSEDRVKSWVAQLKSEGMSF